MRWQLKSERDTAMTSREIHARRNRPLRRSAQANEIKRLTVVVDRLRTWHKPGLLCIGDAAHAMSPLGGVGINLAIQDAVAAANILAAPLASGRLSDDDLMRVQRRRELRRG